MSSRTLVRSGLLTELTRRRVYSILEGITDGCLKIVFDGKLTVFGNPSKSSELESTIRVHDAEFFRAIALRGSMGAGESYMDGLWSCDDLTSAVQIFARNPHLLKTVDSGMGRSMMPVFRLIHRLKRNTRRRVRQNIAEHYDLGNEFFSLFLDQSMMYSCACFDSEESTLEQASLAKMDRICTKLKLGPTDHLIEIGTGWGGFAVHAASRFGCRVTTTTISGEQFRFARDRIRKAGLDEQVTVLQEDYRDLRGSYDKLVSIEMIEAVGHDFLGEYFRKCSSLLHPGGLGLIQAIIKAEEFFEESRKSVDFIQRYIFPGSDIPSIMSIKEGLEEAPEMKLSDLEDITQHYAETLRHWRMRFSDRLQEVRELGFSERFIRMWDFYFSYCEGGFREKHIGDIQLLLEKA
jgi:cyclopropane-fatty-acyl-phospholipid synthase